MMILKLVGAGIVGLIAIAALINPHVMGAVIAVGICVGVGVVLLKAVRLW
jgi:hypothetical protein